MRFSDEWSAPTSGVSCGPHDVHVWVADLAHVTRHNPVYRNILSESELTRARRFVREHDREHFIAARGTLRLLLGRYLGIAPQIVDFVYGPHGKPALNTQKHPEGMDFNISHSDGLALFAFSCGRRVGVDIERERAMPDMEDIAERFFSAREAKALKSLPREARRSAFFNCWCRKEAYIKATGRGLSIPLAGFDVSLKPGEPVALLSVADAPEEAQRWSLQELRTIPGYVAALAVEGYGWKMCRWQFAPHLCTDNQILSSTHN